jgi:hypothetical protein
MFGQFTLEPVCGVPVPPDGAVVLGADDGAGLAAETAATPPPTSSRAETAAVRTVRRRPLGRASDVAGATGGAAGGACAGTSGWKDVSMRSPCMTGVDRAALITAYAPPEWASLWTTLLADAGCGI